MRLGARRGGHFVIESARPGGSPRRAGCVCCRLGTSQACLGMIMEMSYGRHSVGCRVDGVTVLSARFEEGNTQIRLQFLPTAVSK